MNVLLECHDPHSSQLHDATLAQVRRATRRLRWLIADVTVRMSTISLSPAGAVGRCRIELDARRLGRVVITSVARDPRIALDGALRRAARVLVRIWQHSLARRNHTLVLTANTQGRSAPLLLPVLAVARAARPLAPAQN